MMYPKYAGKHTHEALFHPAAFVVSDVLGQHKWDPQFDAKHVNEKLNHLLDAAVACLTKNK